MLSTLKRPLLKVCAGAALATAIAVASSAASAAPVYSQLIVFGDSLSDSGNAYALTGGAFPPAPYSVSFSNGPTAAQYMASKLGIGLTDYAVGGAMTNADNYLALTTPALAPALGNTGISSQIANWNPAGVDPASTLFMVWGGPNDFSYNFELAAAGVPVDFGAVVTNTVSNIAGDITALALKGAHDFFVPNMPDLGITPRAGALGAGFAALASSMSNGYNAGLAQAITELESSLDINIYSFDTAAYMHDILANPPEGLTNLTSSCISGGAAAIGSGCVGYEYFDDIHPTTFAHSLIGEAFANAVPEPSTATMMMLGLGALALTARRRKSGTRHA